MKLQVWKPFRDIERFFEDEDWGVMLPSRFFSAAAIDVYEKDGNLIAQADITGIKPEDIEVIVENNVLTIQGESTKKEEEEKKKYFRRERRYGKIYRSIHLPKSVDSGKTKAEFEAGRLTITMPVSEEAKSKKVGINVKK